MRSEHAVPAARLERFSRMQGFEVDSREPDPRGWTVINRDGRGVGEVKDLIVDTERMVATYLDVELDTKLFDILEDDPHVLVPIERARPDGKRLVVDEISGSWVSELHSERLRHSQEFWDRWWHRGESADDTSPERSVRTTPIRRVDHPDELRRAIDQVRPGEEVRIPVVKEEIIVERRPVAQEEIVVNRAADEPPRRR